MGQKVTVFTKGLIVFMTSLTNGRSQTCQKLAVVWLNIRFLYR